MIAQIFSNIGCHMERPSAIFCNGTCFKGFLLCRIFSICTVGNKSKKVCEYQPDESDDNLIQSKHEEYSYPQKLN